MKHFQPVRLAGTTMGRDFPYHRRVEFTVNQPKAMQWLAGGSIVALAVLVALLYLEAYPLLPSHKLRPVKIYCAAALRPAMQAIAADYTRETGVPIECEFGDSGKMLGQASLRRDGDFFLPADDSYVRIAESQGLVARTIPLCRMHAVVLARPGNPRGIATLGDLLKPGLRLGIANPDRAAIGKVVRDYLAREGKWDTLAARIDVQHGNVSEAANAVQIGSRDATFVWDAVAVNYPDLSVIHLPELSGAIGRVEVAVLADSPNPDGASRFARFIASSDKGLAQLKKAGFSDLEPGTPWRGGGP
jgi:molybdate transport system substrate-binding protein